MPFAVDQNTLFFPFTFGLGMNVIPLIMLWDALNTVCFIVKLFTLENRRCCCKASSRDAGFFVGETCRCLRKLRQTA